MKTLFDSVEWLNYWFECVGEDDDNYGENIFVAIQKKGRTEKECEAEALNFVKEEFPGEIWQNYGWVDDNTAEQYGFDTY